MRFLYDLAYLIFVICYLPVFFFKKKKHPDFSLRLGALPGAADFKRPIWIHAVSVGEALAVKGLAKELAKAYPDKQMVISTVTPTGNSIACSFARANDFVIYLPLDISFIVNKVIKKIDPSVFVIAETEIWPNMITSLYKNNIPVIVVNGRISDRSYRGYSAIRFLLKPILDKVSLFCVQTQRDCLRLKGLGVKEDSIRVTGNMKFDGFDYAPPKADYAGLKTKLEINKEDKILVAGSTHQGEEKMILEGYGEISRSFPDLKLIIAPRHPERAKEVGQLCQAKGYEPVYLSRIDNLDHPCVAKPAIFIIDTIGQLLSFYSVADIVFVGGSLVKTGGHNILEPAFYKKPVIFGPHMFNFKDISDLFLDNQAGLKAENLEELVLIIKRLLTDQAFASDIAGKAKELMSMNQGATLRNTEYIKTYVRD